MDHDHKSRSFQPNAPMNEKIVMQHSEAEGNLNRSVNKDWNAALIITKESINISWERVRFVLGKTVKRQIKIFPFQANKAVWWPNNEEDTEFSLRLKRCFL